MIRRVAAAMIALLIPIAIPATGSSTSIPGEPTILGAPAQAASQSAIPPGLAVSGNLRAFIDLLDSLECRADLPALRSSAGSEERGVHARGLAAANGDSLVALMMQPFPKTAPSMLLGYHLGRWPTRGLAAQDPRYLPPSGFIAVTPENARTMVSKRFHLGDFLTHDQQQVWPKVLVLSPALLEKLELIGDALERRGLSSSIHVMSGFRTPQYNALGVGAKGGRASESRHMYGDAADIFVDADGDGVMDDLDGDGRITKHDAEVLFDVAEGVEAAHPELVGGLSAYAATAAHGPFVHVDVRGKRARW